MFKTYVRLFVSVCLILIASNKVESKGIFHNLWKKVSCFSSILSYKTFRVDFYLSSRNQINEKISIKNFDSDSIDFDPTRMTIVIIPGLTPNLYLDKSNNLRDEFLNWVDVNVIYVDWSEGCSSTFLYIQAVFNTEYVAIQIKKLISEFLRTWKGTNKSVDNWGPVHFIGTSLGAHAAGQAAELLKQGDNFIVDRITALDPAEPCFDDPDSPLRLKKSHARFVDVIHTDAARTKNSRFGLLDPIGHLDFYVNGGSVQPGCRLLRTKRTPNIFLLGYHLTLGNGLCHHLRSIDLFAESLKQAVKGQCTLWAHPWDERQLQMDQPPHGMDSCNFQRCIEMGISANLYRNASGVYYVATTSSSPYCN